MNKVTVEHLKRMHVPEVHWQAVLSKIPEKCEHRKILSEYVTNIRQNVLKPKGLLLFGDYGSGKSALGAICLKAAAAEGIIGLWVRATRLPEFEIEKTAFDETMTMFQRICQVRLLVLDELIVRNELKYTEQSIENVIRRRVDDQLCTIVTTNFSPTQLTEKYPALIAVLKEAVLPVKIAGTNFRDEIAADLKG